MTLAAGEVEVEEYPKSNDAHDSRGHALVVRTRGKPGHRRLTVGSGTATIRISRMHISTPARRRAITVYEPDPPALCASVAESNAVLPLLTGLVQLGFPGSPVRAPGGERGRVVVHG
jgi:hypothetical protein